MLTSLDPIQDILGPHGKMATSLDEFEFRPSQVQMARLIERATREKSPAIIEAGTGTGKTLGYLVPVVVSEKKAKNDVKLPQIFNLRYAAEPYAEKKSCNTHQNPGTEFIIEPANENAKQPHGKKGCRRGTGDSSP